MAPFPVFAGQNNQKTAAAPLTLNRQTYAYPLSLFPEAPLKYLEWNDRLATHFFRPDMAGRSVFLYVTQDLLSEFGGPTSDTWRDFVSATRAGHPWRPFNVHTICQKALHCFETWRGRSLHYPPYLCFLGLFVLAAGKEGDFAPNAYYPRLHELLGDGGSGVYPGFDKMWQLWEDLERWANDDMQGDLGLFSARIVGGAVHVGMPIAQTVLTEHERAALPLVFTAAGLDPTAFPPDAELARLLVSYGTRHLYSRTLSLLRRGADDVELVPVLLEIVKEELARWDGQAEAEVCGEPESLSGSLRLCGTIDRVASTARFAFRCCMNHDFPDEGFLLRTGSKGETFACQEEIRHWSTEISDTRDGRPIDAAQFSWEERVELRETHFGWRFTLRGSAVRLFVDGASEGLPGIIEVFQLPASRRFNLAIAPAARSEVEAWAISACSDFINVPIRKGLPDGWGLFSASGIASSIASCKTYPILCPPTSIRLLLRGGIRASRRNWFLPFGLPEFGLEAPHGAEKVTCAGIELHRDGATYHLPADVPREQKLYAEAVVGTHVIRSQPFFVIGDFTWRWTTPLVSLDRFGAPRDSSLPQSQGAAGASVTGFSPSGVTYAPHPSCFERTRVFFVGREPGQIVSWPAEPVPREWQPVWAIPLERKGRAIFCGTDILASEPLPSRAGSDRKKLKLWKEILYHRQKRIGAPLSPRLSQLWKKFQEAARRA
jgi:hypothetical protein